MLLRGPGLRSPGRGRRRAFRSRFATGASRSRWGAVDGGGKMILVGFDAMHVTQVGAGENAGRTLTEVNVVRSVKELPGWKGAAMSLVVDRPAGARVAVLLQGGDGRVLAAAALE
ncbi:MAG: DUF1223 domain-containing protein [Rhodospirillales bacterium]